MTSNNTKMPKFITFEDLKSKVEDLIVWKVSTMDVAFHFYLHHPIDNHYNLNQHIQAIQTFMDSVVHSTTWSNWKDVYPNSVSYSRLKIYIPMIMEIHEECYEKSLEPGGYQYNKAKENFDSLLTH